MIYRKATFDDIEQIFAIVNDYASDGVMLARSRNTLYETLRDMVVAEDETTNDVVGVGGLHSVWDRMAARWLSRRASRAAASAPKS